MEKINKGFTNKEKYRDGEKMIVVKTHNGFNHGLNYKELSVFPFVPEVIEDNQKEIITKFIEGEALIKPSTTDLQELAVRMRILHKSSIKLPKNNLKQRVTSYLKKMHDKGIHINEIEDNYKTMMKFISKMQRVNPVHNDIWMDNLIKDKDKNIWVLDWEYATMGDKHYDLAYYIEAQRLDEGQIKILLEAYDKVDGKPSHNLELLERYKYFILWFTICWAYAQEDMPFPVDYMIKRLNKYFG